MAITLMGFLGGVGNEKICILACDDVSELPSTGAATVVDDYTGKLAPRTIAYDSGFNTAQLKSDDTWNK